MSDVARDKLVYDCNVYLQFLLNRGGPSGRCVALAFAGEVELFVSDDVLAELRDLPGKSICIEEGVSEAVISGFIEELLLRATLLKVVPPVFVHPVDPDDSCYVNLAIATGANLIVSRDNHLLNLTNPAKPWSRDFRQRFPQIRVLQPPQFLEERDLRTRNTPGQ